MQSFEQQLQTNQLFKLTAVVLLKMLMNAKKKN